MNDLGKIAVVAGVMAALLLYGLFLAPGTTKQATPIEQTVTTEVNVMPQLSLEMLDPIYSEKGVYDDGIIRISLRASHTEVGVESRVPFWLQNVSGDVVTVLWDRCSVQLPCGDTVNVLNDEQLGRTWSDPATSISVAPDADLFDAVTPISEVDWTGDGTITTGVLDQGPFQFVLAIELGGECARQIKHYPFRLVIR